MSYFFDVQKREYPMNDLWDNVLGTKWGELIDPICLQQGPKKVKENKNNVLQKVFNKIKHHK